MAWTIKIRKELNMAVRTAEQYLKSLKDGRVVYCLGEKVKDVTEHPFLKI